MQPLAGCTNHFFLLGGVNIRCFIRRIFHHQIMSTFVGRIGISNSMRLLIWEVGSVSIRVGSRPLHKYRCGLLNDVVRRADFYIWNPVDTICNLFLISSGTRRGSGIWRCSLRSSSCAKSQHILGSSIWRCSLRSSPTTKSQNILGSWINNSVGSGKERGGRRLHFELNFLTL